MIPAPVAGVKLEDDAHAESGRGEACFAAAPAQDPVPASQCFLVVNVDAL